MNLSRPDGRLLLRRPVAHRGLHDAHAGRIENSASAFEAAIARDYAIEMDVQISADGVPLVFHDPTLRRLTGRQGTLREMAATDLVGIPLSGGSDVLSTLAEMLALIGGRVPVLIEIKSHFDGDTRPAAACLDALADYPGLAALMSFDPAIVAQVRRDAPARLRGIVAERHYDRTRFGPAARARLSLLLHWPETRFDFVAYRVGDLSAAPVRLARRLSVPVLAWTVRSAADRAACAKGADQMIFEGFTP